VARLWGPSAVLLGGRILAPRPAAVLHGVRDSTPWVRRQMYISRNFLFDHLFFENQGKINIKKSRAPHWAVAPYPSPRDERNEMANTCDGERMDKETECERIHG
jgi:hypothetical protein